MAMQEFFSELEKNRKVLVFGHRGYSQEYPENTMVSFENCACNPLIDAVELDVHLCRSGEVVVAHDSSLMRTAGIDARIEDLTLDELKKTDVGSFKDPKFSDARIPELRELFAAFGSRFIYDVELKVDAGHVNAALSEKVIAIINEFNLAGRVLISSFNPGALRTFRREFSRTGQGKMPPVADIFARSDEIPKVLQNGKGHIVSKSTYQKPECSQVDAAYLKRYGKRPIITWTVNTREEAQRLLALNENGMHVFGLIGNDPYLLADAVNAKK